MSLPELKLDWCSHAAAKYAVESWHYSRRMPVGKVLYVGVWEGGRFIGTILFTPGTNPHFGDLLGLNPFQVAELARVALCEHRTTVSRIVAVALRLLRQKCPGLRAVISYADPEHGHTGGIYQAGGWVYVGRSSKTLVFEGTDGTRVHSRTANPNNLHFGHKSRDFDTSGMKRVQSTPKFKYLYPLDSTMRARIEPLRKPYPKTIHADAGNRAGKPMPAGGATPIRPLQFKAVLANG